jgi:hypothetical protein
MVFEQETRPNDAAGRTRAGHLAQNLLAFPPLCFLALASWWERLAPGPGAGGLAAHGEQGQVYRVQAFGQIRVVPVFA